MICNWIRLGGANKNSEHMPVPKCHSLGLPDILYSEDLLSHRCQLVIPSMPSESLSVRYWNVLLYRIGPCVAILE